MRRPKKATLWIAFALLCGIAGSQWMAEDLVPVIFQGLTRMAVDSAFLCLVFSGISRSPSDAQLRWVAVAGWGAGMFLLPVILISGAGGKVSSLTEVLCSTLVPAVVVFVVAQDSAGFGADERGLRLLAPALMGVGGAAMLIPFSVPGSVGGVCWLVSIVVAAGVSGWSAVRLREALLGVSVLRAAAVVCGFIAIGAAIGAATSWTGPGIVTWRRVLAEGLWCLLVEAPVWVLSLWQLREMAPVSFAARYFLVPLVTVAEGYFLLHPKGNWTMLAGAVLLGGGGIWLAVGGQEARGLDES